jgi:hypothetical protein
MWSMFWWISEEFNNQKREKKRNSLGYNNPVQYWTWKLLTGWWDSGDCQSWEKWAQLDCTLKDSYQPSQYDRGPNFTRVRHHNMEVFPYVKCSWRRFRLKISKDLKIMQNLQLKNYFEVIFCELRWRFGKKCG